MRVIMLQFHCGVVLLLRSEVQTCLQPPENVDIKPFFNVI